MLFAQPTHRAACPEVIEFFRAGDVGALIEGAVTGENTMWSQNLSYQFKCLSFIWNQMNGITEEGHIGVADNVRQVGRLALNEVGVGVEAVSLHAFAGTPESLCRWIDADKVGLLQSAMSGQLFGNQAGDSSGSAGHIDDGEGSILRICFQMRKSLLHERAVDPGVERMCGKRFKGKLICFFSFDETHRIILLAIKYFSLLEDVFCLWVSRI